MSDKQVMSWTNSIDCCPCGIKIGLGREHDKEQTTLSIRWRRGQFGGNQLICFGLVVRLDSKRKKETNKETKKEKRRLKE